MKLGALLLFAAAMALGSCAPDGRTSVSLRLEAVANQGKKGGVQEVKVDCPYPGKDRLCATLEGLPDLRYPIAVGNQPASPLLEVPKNAACTRQGGPPIEAQIIGVINGDKQEVIIPAYVGGCQANRWKAVEPVFRLAGLDFSALSGRPLIAK